MITAGGLFYLPFHGFNLASSYELHYEMFLTVRSPFNSSYPWLEQVLGALDGLLAYLLLPSLIGVVFSRSQARIAARESLEASLERAYFKMFKAQFPDLDDQVLNEQAKRAAKDAVSPF